MSWSRRLGSLGCWCGGGARCPCVMMTYDGRYEHEGGPERIPGLPALLKPTFKDKVFDEPDDQSALVYLEWQPWREKVVLERATTSLLLGLWCRCPDRRSGPN